MLTLAGQTINPGRGAARASRLPADAYMHPETAIRRTYAQVYLDEMQRGA